MRTIFCSLILMISLQVGSQHLVSSELVSTLTQEELDVVGFIVPDFGVKNYKLVYNTTDTNGDPTIASGMLSVPDAGLCYGFPMLVYMHGTTLNKENVPSRDNDESFIGKFMGGLGYYACAPDYIGMGDSPGLHPYVHAESEATSGIDMVRAAREFIAQESLTDNGQVFITGYSQGGHAAMAMHKYIEDNAMLDEFDITASAPGSGPYDLSGSMLDVILSGEPYSNPGYLVYVMASYDLAYDNLFDSYADVLQAPYDGVVPPFFDGNNTTLTMPQLNAQLTEVVEDLIVESLLTELDMDPDHPLRLDLEDNDNHDWAPTRPISMYYCDQDEQVHFTNSTVAQANFEANGSTVTNAVLLGPLDHGNCYLPAMLGALNFFATLKQDCVLGLEEMDMGLEFTFNETQLVMTLTSAHPMDLVQVYDAAGRMIHSQNTQGAQTYSESVATLPSGVYHVRVFGMDSRAGLGSFVIR